MAPADAITQLARMRAVPGHRFLPDDVPLVVDDQLPLGPMISHRHIGDAHLIALVRRHRARLATLDRSIAALAGEQSRDSVLIIAVR